jgi:hypothetical protein
MAGESTESLSYAPTPAYLYTVRGRSAGVAKIVMAGVSLTLGEVFRRYLADDDWMFRVVFLTCWRIMWGGLALFGLIEFLRNGSSECRIQGGRLYLRGTLSRKTAPYDLADIAELRTTRSNGGDMVIHSVILHDGTRVVLSHNVVGSFDRFAAALIGEQPTIRRKTVEEK